MTQQPQETEMYNFADVLPANMINLDFDVNLRLPVDQVKLLTDSCKIRFIDAEDSVLVATEYLNKEVFELSLGDTMHIQLSNAGVTSVDYENMITGMLLTRESAKKYHQLLINNNIPHTYLNQN